MTAANTAPHPTRSALAGALMVVEAADKAGLPVPTYVTTNSYAVVEFGGDTSVSWQPDSLDDLRQWAKWLGAEVVQSPHKDTVHHNVDATVFDQRVSLCFIEHREVAS